MSKWYSNRDTVSGLHDVPVLVVLCLPSNCLSCHWISKAKLLLFFHFGPFKHCSKLQSLSLGWKYKRTALKSSKSEFGFICISPGVWKDHTQPCLTKEKLFNKSSDIVEMPQRYLKTVGHNFHCRTACPN